MTAQLALEPTKQPAACRQEEQPALQQQRLEKLENSMLKDLPTRTGHRRSETGQTEAYSLALAAGGRDSSDRAQSSSDITINYINRLALSQIQGVLFHPIQKDGNTAP